MSLVLAIMNKDNIFIGSDTATSICKNNDVYRKDNNSQKLYMDKDKVIFCAGYNPLVKHVMNNYFKSSRTKEDLLHIIKNAKQNEVCKDIFLSYKTSMENTEIDNQYFVGSMVATFENGVPVLYGINSKDLIIEKYSLMGNSGISLYTLGMKDDECRNIATDLLKSGIDVLETYQRAFECVAYEGVGGNLQIYHINKDNNINFLANSPIREKNISWIKEGSYNVSKR